MQLNLVDEGDEGKKNIRKHGIYLLEALPAITDPLSIHLYDEAHSETEDRWLAIGNLGGRILVARLNYSMFRRCSDLRDIPLARGRKDGHRRT